MKLYRNNGELFEVITVLEAQELGIQPTLIKHFKRETIDQNTNEYLYNVITVGENTETEETFIVYQAFYGDNKVYLRPINMFLSEVEAEKYPDIKQKYRFDK